MDIAIGRAPTAVGTFPEPKASVIERIVLRNRSLIVVLSNGKRRVVDLSDCNSASQILELVVRLADLEWATPRLLKLVVLLATDLHGLRVGATPDTAVLP